MTYLVDIDIMPRRELLDPQGKTVGRNLPNLGVQGVEDVRIGKHIQMTMTGESEEEVRKMVTLACEKLLANLIMETFTFTIKPLS